MSTYNNRPHSSFHEEERRPPQMVVLIVVGGAFVVGMGLMASSNRTELGLIIGQFAALWPIAQNRVEMLRVVFKILFTGLVFAAIALACSLAFSVVRGYRQDEQEEAQPAVVVRTRTSAMVGLPSTPRRNATQAAHPQGTFPRPMVSQLPFTPIPETLIAGAEISAPIEKERATPIYEETMQRREEQGNQQAEQTADEERQEHPSIYITITLLKTITMMLHVPGSTKAYPVTLDDLNGKALQLIAYIAVKQGGKVALGDMRDQVFGNDEMETTQVQEALNTAKREIRRRINQTVERARNDFSREVFPPDLDIFCLSRKRYWLPTHCQVTDLALIEEQHQLIEQAETSNQLVNTVSDAVYQACMTLINAYSGDFIEDLLENDPYSFDPPANSWAREPFTQFRDYYLQAILYAAEYERKRGDGAKLPAQQREFYAEAARLFTLGAMAACNRLVFDGRFDTKVSFSNKPGRRHGAHVLLSEQLMRRAIALYGKMGSTIVAKRVYSTYEQQMLAVSNKVWSADPETLTDVEAALQKTGAYRFPDTIASPDDLSSTLVSEESA